MVCVVLKDKRTHDCLLALQFIENPGGIPFILFIFNWLYYYFSTLNNAVLLGAVLHEQKELH